MCSSPNKATKMEMGLEGGGGGARTKFLLKGALFSSHLTILQSRRQKGLFLALVKSNC